MNAVDIADLDWTKSQGLVPAIVQHARSGAVLMLGYMNREALRATLDTRRVTFFSRSRRKLWTKGETSGHVLELISVTVDCDGDALLVQALPSGPVCHRGTKQCFQAAQSTDGEALAFLGELERVVAERFVTRPSGSYTAKLLAEGPGRIAQKVGEEALEVSLAAVGGSDSEVRSEAADLLFHLTVLLRQRGIALADIVHELELRHAAKR